MHCKIFSSALDLYPLEGRSLLPFPVMTKIHVSRHGQMSPGGQNFSWLRTIALEVSVSGKNTMSIATWTVGTGLKMCHLQQRYTPFKMSWYMVLDGPSKDEEFAHKTSSHHVAKTSPCELGLSDPQSHKIHLRSGACSLKEHKYTTRFCTPNSMSSSTVFLCLFLNSFLWP